MFNHSKWRQSLHFFSSSKLYMLFEVRVPYSGSNSKLAPSPVQLRSKRHVNGDNHQDIATLRRKRRD